MKTLALAFFAFMALAVPAAAHDGALSLYTNQTITDCDLPSALFLTDTIRLYYVRGSGPDMGNAAEFRIEKSSLSVFFAPSPTWSNLIVATLGDIENGISITAAGCLGVGEAVVYLGEIYVLNGGEFGTFTVKVVNHPVSLGILITRCEPLQPIHPVLGGTFIFNGTCNPAVEETSWGAIKSLYR